MDFTGKKLGKIMQQADQMGVRFVAVIGENEIKSGEVDLKEMATGAVMKAPLNNLARILNIEAQSDEFVKIWNEMAQPFQDPKESEFFIQKLHSTIQETEQLSENLRVAMEGMKDLIDKDKPN
jgi:histidyl-tRNA synthetase